MTCKDYLAYLEVCGKLPFNEEDLREEYNRIMSGNIDIRETMKILNTFNKSDNDHWEFLYYFFSPFL